MYYLYYGIMSYTPIMSLQFIASIVLVRLRRYRMTILMMRRECLPIMWSRLQPPLHGSQSGRGLIDFHSTNTQLTYPVTSNLPHSPSAFTKLQSRVLFASCMWFISVPISSKFVFTDMLRVYIADWIFTPVKLSRWTWRSVGIGGVHCPFKCAKL